MLNHTFEPVELAPYSARSHGERDTLVSFLELFRSILLRKAAGLDSSQLATTLGTSPLTIGGLLKHMALVEDHWFHSVFAGNADPEPWASVDWDTSPDWEFDTAQADTPAELLAQFQLSVGRSDEVLATADDVDAVAARQPQAQPNTLRWILVHMVEEYARHCGHADLIRESIDGQTGD